MPYTRICALAGALCLIPSPNSTAANGEISPYTGQQTRPIAALSPQDVEDLLAGRGWGFAKPAELNGYPGPLHVLELREALGLSDHQASAVERVFASMRLRAIALGGQYVAAEQALDAAFAEGAVKPETLADLVSRAAELRGQLRAVHLTAHLETRPLLTHYQLMRYQQLRGYHAEPHHRQDDH